MFIRGGWVHLSSRWGSLGTSAVVVFTLVCPWGRWVHQGSLDSLVFALWVVVFIRLRWVHSQDVRFIRGRWVHLRSHCVSLGSSRVVTFTRVRLWGGWIHPGSLGSLGFVLGVVGFIRGCWVHSGSPLGSMGLSGVV